MREVDNENPNEMYNQARKSLKKYYGSSSTSKQIKPALEGCTTSPTIAEHLNALVNARKAFTQIDTSRKLKKVLKYPVRSYCDIKYVQGISVFYKLPDEPRWQGAASVIGVHRKVIILKHGSVLRRLHPCRLQHIHHNNCGTKDSKSNEHDNSNKMNDDDSSDTNDNSMIPIVDSKTES